MIVSASVRFAAEGERSPRGAIVPAGDTPDLDFHARILIVEDELMIAWMIQSLVEDMGFSNVEIATDSQAALAAFERAAPALIISDINLGSGPDGVETARRIVKGRRIPVLFVSAYADADARLRMAEHLPAATILRKPVEADALARAVRAMLAQARSVH